MQALLWSPLVARGERASFEQRQRDQGQTDYRISQRDTDGLLHPAPDNSDYAPITYIEPAQVPPFSRGLDLAGDAVSRSALQQARERQQTVLSAPLPLVSGLLRQTGVLLVRPVRHEQSLKGYLVAVVNLVDLIDAALNRYPRDTFHLRIDDLSEGRPGILFSEDQQPLPDYAGALLWREPFELGGRQLVLQISPSQSLLQHSRSLQPWLIQAGGLAMCALLGAFLLILSGQSEHIRRQVRQRTEELGAVLEHAAEAILIVTDDGHIDSANPAAIQLFQAPGMLSGLDARHVLPKLDFSQPQSTDALLGRSSEMPGQSLQGKPLELEVSLSRYLVAERPRYICLLRDISERKRIERLKNEFVATVSHELRTPLTSIKGSLGLLNAGVAGPLPATAEELLSIAHSNAERLSSLVNDILDIEKLEFGQAALRLDQHRLGPLLEEALRLNQGFADSYEVRLELKLDALPTDSSAMIEPQRLQQVLANLISNAVKFSPRAGLVRLEAHPLAGGTRISIHDQGPGIAESFRSQLFQKFAQADSSDTRQQGGTGLGLSICKALVERMHGEIGYRPGESGGSTFYVDLPNP